MDNINNNSEKIIIDFKLNNNVKIPYTIVKMIFLFIDDYKAFFAFGMTCKKANMLCKDIFKNMLEQNTTIKKTKLYVYSFSISYSAIINSKLGKKICNEELHLQTLGWVISLTLTLVQEKYHSNSSYLKIQTQNFFEYCNNHLAEFKNLQKPFPTTISKETEVFFTSHNSTEPHFLQAKGIYQKIDKTSSVVNKLFSIFNLLRGAPTNEWDEPVFCELRKHLYALFDIAFKKQII